MKTLLKVGNSIAAEYVGLGSYGKHVIVNAYGGNIRVQNLPAKIPLAFYMELYPHENTPTTLKFELKIGRKTKAELEATFVFQPGIPGLIVMPQIAVDIPKALDIKVLAHGEGYPPVTLFKTRVFQDDII